MQELIPYFKMNSIYKRFQSHLYPVFQCGSTNISGFKCSDFFNNYACGLRLRGLSEPFIKPLVYYYKYKYIIHPIFLFDLFSLKK